MVISQILIFRPAIITPKIPRREQPSSLPVNDDALMAETGLKITLESAYNEPSLIEKKITSTFFLNLLCSFTQPYCWGIHSIIHIIEAPTNLAKYF